MNHSGGKHWGPRAGFPLIQTVLNCRSLIGHVASVYFLKSPERLVTRR